MRHPLSRQYFNASRVSLAVSALLLAQSALAQDFIKGGQDTFTFNQCHQVGLRWPARLE